NATATYGSWISVDSLGRACSLLKCCTPCDDCGYERVMSDYSGEVLWTTRQGRGSSACHVSHQSRESDHGRRPLRRTDGDLPAALRAGHSRARPPTDRPRGGDVNAPGQALRSLLPLSGFSATAPSA